MEPGSITGPATGPRVPRPPGRSGGFTLIELLTVVVIIGIVVTFAVLSVNVNEGHQLKEQAQQVAALIELAKEESILDAREMAVQFKDGAYTFYAQADDGKWAAWGSDGPFHAGRFAPGVNMDLTIEGQDATDSTGVGSMLPGSDNSDQKVPEALVYILSSGEITPFELTLTREGEPGYQIIGKLNGDVSMKKYDKS